MDASSPQLAQDRLAIGQLLVRLLHHFRQELLGAARAQDRYPDLRFSHLAIWGNVGVDGIRLTELADRANLSMAACSEQVSELEGLGYLERRKDPRDGRAKLIFPTSRGRELLADAGREVAALEARWRALAPEGSFDEACSTLDTILSSLDRR